MHWYRQQLKIVIKLVTDCFQGQANVTAFHISTNVMSEGWLMTFSGQMFMSFLNIKIADQGLLW